MSDRALVSIAVPTYNRAGTLERTLESALAQTHREIELLVFDNASTDATGELCARFAARDARVRYRRHPRNIGPTANFNSLFAACRGDFVMALADDDWIDREYVEACLAGLRADSAAALVAGRPLYYRDAARVSIGVELNLLSADPVQRVLGYYREVKDNGTFYGLMRAPVLRAAAPMPNRLGNDWLLLAAVAFQGHVRTTPQVAIHRELDGTSEDLAKIVRTFGGGTIQQRLPHAAMSTQVAIDILARGRVYGSLPVRTRAFLALRCAVASMDWVAQAWYLSEPLSRLLARRALTRPLWRAHERLTCRLVERRRARVS